MADDINFLDLACLMKISNDTTLERFGSAINASIFDASNIAGTLKQKDLIDFTSIFPGPNSIAITESAKAVLAEAEQRASTPFDNLDKSIITQISNGKNSPKEIQSSINLNSRDLAMRIYKLSKQNLLTYELKSGHVDLLLTEQGFLKASPQQLQQMHTMQSTQAQNLSQTPSAVMSQSTQGQGTQQSNPQQTAEQAKEPLYLQPKPKSKKMLAAMAIVAIIIILLLVYLLVIR